MGCYPTGVAVVTTRGRCGQAVGMTINSFCSISLDPPMLGWCLDLRSGSYTDFRCARGFTVSVLNEQQADLARRFATRGADKFEGINLEALNQDGIELPGACAAFRCRLQRVIPLGDHVMLVGQVTAFGSADRSPLTFVHGGFRQLQTTLDQAA
nr:flavin reductase family protein [Pseudomaricurvus sp. HS19]